MLAPEPKALAASSVTKPAPLDNRSNPQNDSGVRTPTQLTDCVIGRKALPGSGSLIEGNHLLHDKGQRVLHGKMAGL
jgi:hypothetical protein